MTSPDDCFGNSPTPPIGSTPKDSSGRTGSSSTVRYPKTWTRCGGWAKRPEALAELLDRGWWRDDGDCYVIIHHACYQRPREQVVRMQERNRENGRGWAVVPPRPPREQAPRKPRTPKTQVGSEVGSDGENTKTQVGSKNSAKPQVKTQMATQRDRTGLDRNENRGTSLEEDPEVCHDCGFHPPVGDSARGNDNRSLCRACNDARLADLIDLDAATNGSRPGDRERERLKQLADRNIRDGYDQ